MRKPKELPDRLKEQTESYNPFDRHEIIGGIRYELTPAPIVSHQVLVKRICQTIETGCHADGLVLTSPVDVYLDESNTVQPDIVYIANDNMDIVHREKIAGPPNLVVEILSPSTGLKDKTIKKKLYETFGIQEYWIVDGSYDTIDQFVLHDGKYTLHATYGPGDSLHSPMFACISLDVGKLFASIERFK